MLKHVRLKKGSHAQTRKEGVEKECSPSSTKYRGPVDSTVGAQELGEHKEDVPWSFLCPDAADQELDDTACWQIAARKMQIMQEQALAVRQEEELAADLGQDKTGRKLLLNTCKEFQAAVGKVMAQSTMQTLERALQAEVGPPQENTPNAMAVHTQAATPEEGDADSANQAKFKQRTDGTQDLIVPTRRKFAKMWEPGFWQEWNPMLWCYGDCVYGDPKLNEEPYKQPTFKQFCKNLLLREELEYDLYPGEHYEAEAYGQNHWQHDPDVEALLREAAEASARRSRTKTQDKRREWDRTFAVNRFRKDQMTIFVLSTFWRLMAGFTAINIGMRIPGVLRKLKALANMPSQVVLASAAAGDKDGLMSLVREATHLFNLVMGKVVGSNAYRISSRHAFSAYTIFFGTPLIFCTPNIADNRNFLILITQGERVNLDIDADVDLQISYAQLRLRVVNDPVGQSIVVELLLRLFVLHCLGARHDCVAQPQGRDVLHREWLTDGVAASLTSLGCLCILLAGRGELEASGRGSLHGHWELFGLTLTMKDAIEAFRDLSPHEKVTKLRHVVMEWLNFFQRSHHSSVQHLPFVYGGAETWSEPLPLTQTQLEACRMDGRQENVAGYKKATRPCAAQRPLDTLPKKLPKDDLYVPEEDSDIPPGPPQIKQKVLCGQTLSSFPRYRRLKYLKRPSLVRLCAAFGPRCNADEELCSSCWREMHVRDSWHVQTRAMIHVCGPSCWKYNKDGTRVCRHHVYHITVLEPDSTSDNPAEKPLKLRRDGRPLNNQLYIQEEASKSRRGRIVPITVMPYETMTNYSVANSLRCNFDNQSLLYLPPRSVLKLFLTPNIGPKPEYAHMERKEGDLEPKWLLHLTEDPVDTSMADTDTNEHLVDCEELLKEIELETTSAFQDAHNAGFYINEYTTKVNALGDKLLQGLQRASPKVLQQEASAGEVPGKNKDRERIKAVLKKLTYLMNSLQVKSGSELVFPMLYDHMS